MEEPLVYTVAEVSERLKIGKTTVRRLIQSRELLAIYQSGRWLVPRSELLRWLELRIEEALEYLYEPE